MKKIWVAGVCAAMVCPAFSAVLRLKSGDINTSAVAMKSTAKSVAVQQETEDGKVCQLVQFSRTPDQTDRDRLGELGGEVVGYVPDHALLVLMDAADSGLLDTLPGVEWTGPCLAEYKLDSSLDLTQSELEVVISLFKPGFLKRVEWWIEQRQGTIIDSGKGATRASIRARLPSTLIEELALLAEVEWVEPFVQMKVFNNVAVEAPRLNVKTVWETHGLTGKGQVVAVADTGLDTGGRETIHPDFAGRIRYATSWVLGDDWRDYHGHGTHVAGSVLGSGAAYSNGLYRGVAYEAELVMQALGKNNNSGAIYDPNPLALLFEQAYTNGARIHQNSWGGNSDGQYTFKSREVDDFMWRHDDMLIVFAAGNEGVDGDRDGVVDWQSLGVPASAKNCLSVGAAESERASLDTLWPDVFGDPIQSDLKFWPWDGIHQGMAAFSSRGPCADGRIKPDVVAPGTGIVSCRSRYGELWGALSGEEAELYHYGSGTSMATPMVSGMAALARQYFNEYHGVTNPSAALLKAAIINGAVSLYPGQYGTGEYREIPNTTGNNVEGWGQVNAGNTFFPEGKENIFWDRNRLQTAEEHAFELEVTDTNGISATLAWTDPPASLISSHQLVNDLDLMLVSPSGATNYPNGLSGADHTNNVEQVDLATCETGLWTLVVSGYSVPQGPQPYALVSSVSGDANAFEVTSVWHEPSPVAGPEDPVELFASVTVGDKSLATVAMGWREDGGEWAYEPLTLVATNGENRIYSATIDISDVGVFVDYYAYAFSYDMQLVKSSTNQFKVNSPVVYVYSSGTQTWPYNSLQTAYTNLMQAIEDAAPSSEIRVADGLYEIEQVILDDGIRLVSLNGPESTVLNFTQSLRSPMFIYDATVSGFAIEGGETTFEREGGGVTMVGGVLSNCWVRGCISARRGGGVLVYDGLVTHCVIEDNGADYGGGVYLAGGGISHCRIENNSCTDSGGGLVTKAAGIAEYLIVANNQSAISAGGIGIIGGTVRNCTVFNNFTSGLGGGIGISAEALVENCIIVSNRALAGYDNWGALAPLNMRYTCTSPLAPGIGNMDLDPMFADAAAGDYHLQSTYGRFTTNGWVMDAQDSPCIDFGSPLSDASQESTASRINMGAYGNTAEASRSGTNATRLIVQSMAGTTDPVAGLHIYPYGESETVVLTEDPLTVGSTQYQFSAWSLDDGWSQASDESASLELALTNNWIVRASHDPFYQVNLYAGTNGSVLFSNGWYAAGSILSATAVPNLYYAFDGWTGHVSSTNNPLSLQLNQPMELWAAFAPAYTANNVPHWWLGQYGLTNNFEAASTADQDGDGAQTWQEYVAGTLPLNSNSVLKLSLNKQSDANTLTWDAQAGRYYTVYYASNLEDGITNTLATYYSIFPTTMVLPDSIHADEPSMFYRIQVEYNE